MTSTTEPYDVLYVNWELMARRNLMDGRNAIVSWLGDLPILAENWYSIRD